MHLFFVLYYTYMNTVHTHINKIIKNCVMQTDANDNEVYQWG